MIIIDYNALAVSSILTQLTHSIPGSGQLELSENLGRHVILSNLLYHKKNHSKKYGKLILAGDGYNYWRKDIFPYYKASRKVKTGKALLIDWTKLHNISKLVKEEIETNLGYKVIEVPKCEADDIIYVLAKDLREKSVIISSDKDFLQLHNPNIDQWSLRHKKLIKSVNPEIELRSQIIQGDRIDGIPNMLSDSDTFVNPGKRQTPLSKKKLEEWCKQPPELFCTTDKMYEGFKRNETLIDLSKIPEEYEIKIREAISINNIARKPGTLFNYFVKSGLNALMSDIGDF